MVEEGDGAGVTWSVPEANVGASAGKRVRGGSKGEEEVMAAREGRRRGGYGEWERHLGVMENEKKGKKKGKY